MTFNKTVIPLMAKVTAQVGGVPRTERYYNVIGKLDAIARFQQECSIYVDNDGEEYPINPRIEGIKVELEPMPSEDDWIEF